MAFATSTQKKNWLFEWEQLENLRQTTNEAARLRYKESNDTEDDSVCFGVANEFLIVRKFICLLKRLHTIFVPPLPQAVYGTAVTYFKRFYLRHSVMDFYPREIMLTCLYLACKVTEFNVSMMAFVENIPRNKERYRDFIVNSELFLMEELSYDLLVHTPYKPLAGLLLDMFTFAELENGDLLQKMVRDGVDLLDTYFQTDLCLVVAPSQVALSLVSRLANDNDMSSVFAEYVGRHLCQGDATVKADLLEKLSFISQYIDSFDFVNDFKDLRQIEERMDICRNQLYNPDSELYQSKKRVAEAKYCQLDDDL